MDLKSEISALIDSHSGKILSIAEQILKNPELGFKEYKTGALTEDFFRQHHIEYTSGHAITGVKGRLRGKESRASVCIIGEMDAVACPGHPYADACTSAAHACGHNIQMACMLGAALVFSEPGLMEQLYGDLIFMAVPAEEFIELSFREQLKRQGKLQYPSGKQQLIFEGGFDDVDMALMLHAHPDTRKRNLFLQGGSLGFVAESIRFTGKQAHASTPSDGINALNAALVGLMSIHANRDTFSEKDHIRIHPIITNGGDIVNTVPSDVTLETYVRASSKEAITRGSALVRRCMEAGALALGASVTVEEQKGYLPLCQDSRFSEIFEQNAKLLVPEAQILHGIDMVGSSDIGDLSHLLPCIQPTIGGFSGAAHSPEFTGCDGAFNLIDATKMICFTIVDLLSGGAGTAREIIDGFLPAFTKQEYLYYLNEKGEK